jgi:uncharacterized membrane protein YidH (DUF202 family)
LDHFRLTLDLIIPLSASQMAALAESATAARCGALLSRRSATTGLKRAPCTRTASRVPARPCVASVNIPADISRAAVAAALRGLRDATGHAVNASAAVGLPDVQLFLTSLFAPPFALLQHSGRDAVLATCLTALLMVTPLVALLRWADPTTRQDTEGPRPLALMSLMAASAFTLVRVFVFTTPG